MERPALCSVFFCKLTSLANFVTIGFYVVSAGSTQFGSSNSDSITMVDRSGYIMAQPSSISSGAFSVKWYKSS